MIRRIETLDAALALVDGRVRENWSLEPDDVRLARGLVEQHPTLGARELVHRACCRRRGVDRIETFDRGLAGALRG